MRAVNSYNKTRLGAHTTKKGRCLPTATSSTKWL